MYDLLTYYRGYWKGILMAEKYKHTWAERNALLRTLERLRKTGDEREFMQVLRTYGVKDEDPRFAEILKPFRELRSGKT